MLSSFISMGWASRPAPHVVLYFQYIYGQLCLAPYDTLCLGDEMNISSLANSKVFLITPE